VNPLDWAILGIGFLTFIFSFVDYYSGKVTTSGNCFGFTGGTVAHENSWHGFFGWFAALCALVGAGAIAVDLFAPTVRMPAANRLIAVIAFAVALLCVILAFWIHPGTGQSVSESVGSCHIKGKVGHAWGYWLSLILIAIGTVLALMRAQQTNTAMPGPLNKIPKIG
jgi:ABC-type branched-subunit amino acid transport system permease subunit